jgi:hypothetical protein
VVITTPSRKGVGGGTKTKTKIKITKNKNKKFFPPPNRGNLTPGGPQTRGLPNRREI